MDFVKSQSLDLEAQKIEMRKEFHRIDKACKETMAKIKPLKAERDKLAETMEPTKAKMRVLADKFKAIQESSGLFEMTKYRGELVHFLNGKTGTPENH